MIRRTIVAVLSLSLYLSAQARAEDKEPFALVELGAATERSIQENASSFGPTAAVEFPVVKDWLEIEIGISPLFRPGQTEWQTDFLLKEPFTLSDKVEFMIGAGPQLSYATFGGGTKIAGEVVLEWMIWPSADRKLGWFVTPTYSYSFSRGHERACRICNRTDHPHPLRKRIARPRMSARCQTRPFGDVGSMSGLPESGRAARAIATLAGEHASPVR